MLDDAFEVTGTVLVAAEEETPDDTVEPMGMSVNEFELEGTAEVGLGVPIVIGGRVTEVNITLDDAFEGPEGIVATTEVHEALDDAVDPIGTIVNEFDPGGIEDVGVLSVPTVTGGNVKEADITLEVARVVTGTDVAATEVERLLDDLVDLTGMMVKEFASCHYWNA